MIGCMFSVTMTFGQYSPVVKPSSKYDPHVLFTPMFYPGQGNSYRAANGEPGTDYWQNKADYQIDVSLDTLKNEISGTVVITYRNNSPHALPYLWLQLEQNAFRNDSRSLATKLFFKDTVLNPISTATNYVEIKSQKIKEAIESSRYADYGFKIKSVTLISERKAEQKADFVVNDTRMQILLTQPVTPSGGTTKIKIVYSYNIPEYFSTGYQNRTDILYTEKGKLYSIAQWYPRMCVFDDIEGWNTLPYLGLGEFYLEYGDFDVNITVPSSCIVVASGELMNPGEVLTPMEYERWKQAKNSEHKVYIRTRQDLNNPGFRQPKDNLTWKFSMKNSRDFAWAASKAFIWEGFRINIPNGKKVFGMSVYPPESDIDSIWGRASEFVKFTIENYSKRWYDYPYPCAVNVAAKADGMEYPGIVFCRANAPGANYLWGLTNHELAHNWFPMIVGSNERKHAWMDEGFVMFIAEIASQDLNRKELPGNVIYHLPNADYFVDTFTPIVSLPDASNGEEVWKIQYLKMAYVMGLLRNQIIGADRFDMAFRKYIHDWAYKHPTPWDFFRSIENSVGENLSWYWTAMFFNNYNLDQAISNVEYNGNDPKNGVTVTVDNLDRMAMPLLIEYTTKSGKKEEMKFPVEIWMVGYQYQFHIPATEEIQSVAIDPKGIFPDVNKANNVWINQ